MEIILNVKWKLKIKVQLHMEMKIQSENEKKQTIWKLDRKDHKDNQNWKMVD